MVEPLSHGYVFNQNNQDNRPGFKPPNVRHPILHEDGWKNFWGKESILTLLGRHLQVLVCSSLTISQTDRAKRSVRSYLRVEVNECRGRLFFAFSYSLWCGRIRLEVCTRRKSQRARNRAQNSKSLGAKGRGQLAIFRENENKARRPKLLVLRRHQNKALGWKVLHGRDD